MQTPITALAFVAGATGYTGREVVAALRRRGVTTVAHVRPGSSAAETWVRRFEALGATVDRTPWEDAAMTATLAALRPTLLFALLGTTRKRAEREGLDDAYERIDYGLTATLLRAARTASASRPSDAAPRFVYLSSLGAREDTRNEYLRVRGRIERELAESGLPYLSVRPAFITGPDREESRPLERVAGAAVDGVLALAWALGARTLRARWASLTGRELAEGMVAIALADPRGRAVVDPVRIREAVDT